ncbi:hypothetical protein [Streptococcus cuniculi]|uniref:Uncharacterized protein n=1 Tax=Streptococcus cuniculi TaxID=1432788 RepID=A0A4Y9JE99_9STRE|nr:hypothetical protein [Streptococcus cuniculi]MBF0777877.1 hypothetical protein [Streptococcus cuniculi]TFU98175.1 hypothetical protein E4T82_03960 [Streptococcus cuniculi]
MLARIRLHKSGIGHWLPKVVELFRFSEEDIRQRLVDVGLSYDEELLVVGIDDWELEKNMSLSEAYALKTLIQQEYAGDEFVVVHLLKNCHLSVSDVINRRYSFLSRDEEEAMIALSREYDSEILMKMFYRANNWVSLIVAFVDAGEILNTSRGFFKKIS